MPHLTMYAVESQIVDHESALIKDLTDAVSAVYGERFRTSVVVRLVAILDSRWGIGGEAGNRNPAPEVRMGVRATAFDRDDWPAVAQRLVSGITDAVARAIGENVRAGTLVELVPEHDDRTAIGGTLVRQAPTVS